METKTQLWKTISVIATYRVWVKISVKKVIAKSFNSFQLQHPIFQFVCISMNVNTCVCLSLSLSLYLLMFMLHVKLVDFPILPQFYLLLLTCIHFLFIVNVAD